MNKLEMADLKKPSELRLEVNNALSSAEGLDYAHMFVREARKGSYPFPNLELQDKSFTPERASSDKASSAVNESVNLQQLIDILEDTAHRQF